MISHNTIHTAAALRNERCPECGQETSPPVVKLQDAIAQEIWQRYVVEVGRSMPEGLADKLAASVVDLLSRSGVSSTPAARQP